MDMLAMWCALRIGWMGCHCVPNRPYYRSTDQGPKVSGALVGRYFSHHLLLFIDSLSILSCFSATKNETNISTPNRSTTLQFHQKLGVSSTKIHMYINFFHSKDLSLFTLFFEKSQHANLSIMNPLCIVFPGQTVVDLVNHELS